MYIYLFILVFFKICFQFSYIKQAFPVGFFYDNNGPPYRSLNWLLPSGLLAQLVECCTNIADVKGSNPIQA